MYLDIYIPGLRTTGYDIGTVGEAMLVAAVVTALGFAAVAVATRRYGVRLGGTVVVGVLATYTLKDFSTLPLFVSSTAAAYATLWYVKRHTLLYGRDEFVVALLAGSLLPTAVFLLLPFVPGGSPVGIGEPIIVGSLLSGIAAFNFHQVRADYRRRDLAGTAGLYAGLLLGGALLVSPSTRFLADHTSLMLFAHTSDIAVLRGAVVEGYVDPGFVARPFVVGIFVLTLGASEQVRKRFGLRVGTVALGLMAIYTVSTWRLLALYLVAAAVVFATVTLVHRAYLVYGRALLGTAATVGVLLSVPLSVAFDVSAGISPLFAGILAGVLGYYLHYTPPRERRRKVALVVAIYVGLVVAVRSLVPPGADGLPRTFGPPEAAVAVLVALGAAAYALHDRIEQPDDTAVRAASIFERGGSRRE